MGKSILDLLPKEEAEKAIERGRRRIERQRQKKGLDVSPELYIVSEFGYYFGWEALLAIRRGYTVVPGTNEKEILTLDEAQLLLEGARKVWYSKLIEQVNAGVISNSYRSSSTFDNAMAPLKEKADIKE